MPISCHFRDCKALLVAYSCKTRYSKYRTVTFSSSVDQDACRRTWARDAFYDDWLRYTGVHPVRPPSDSDQRFSSFTTTLNYFATSIALDAQQAVRRRSIDVPSGADTFKIEQGASGRRHSYCRRSNLVTYGTGRHEDTIEPL